MPVLLLHGAAIGMADALLQTYSMLACHAGSWGIMLCNCWNACGCRRLVEALPSLFQHFQLPARQHPDVIAIPVRLEKRSDCNSQWSALLAPQGICKYDGVLLRCYLQ